jgi:hypothetical protein
MLRCADWFVTRTHPHYTRCLELVKGIQIYHSEQAKRLHILQILEQTEGVVGGKSSAAARLGMHRTTLIYKMRRLGIDLGQSSALPMRAEESPISEIPSLRTPSLSRTLMSLQVQD